MKKKPAGCLFCLVDAADVEEGVKRMAYSCIAHFAVERMRAHPATFTDACAVHCEHAMHAGVLITRIMLGDKEAEHASQVINELKMALGRGST